MEDLNYIMFENKKNNCWLDAALVLIAHSKNINNVIKTVPHTSQIQYIVSEYNNAQAILNDENKPVSDRFAEARTKLHEIQINISYFLEKFLKFKAGEPESAFCALYTLFHHDNSKIKKLVYTSYFWDKKCKECGLNSKTSVCKRSIITLSKVPNYFQPASLTSSYTCSCQKVQEMKLVYKELPNCLMFHFEKGVEKGHSIPLQFVIGAREYHLTGIIILEKGNEVNLNHFVTWVRQPSADMWLNCNDLQTFIVKYCRIKPEMELKDLYMCLYEAFDDFGVIQHDVSAADVQAENENAELIYLSDESEDPRSAPTIVVVKPSESDQKPLGDKINNIADYLAENMLTEELDDCKQNHDTSQASKIPDTENASNPEVLNIDNMSSTGQFSGAIEHEIKEKDENLMKKTGIPNVSEINANVETLNDPNQKGEVIEEQSVSIKSALDKCEEDGEEYKKMPLSIQIKENISQNDSLELEETDKKCSRSSSLCSQNEENSLSNKGEIAEKNSVLGTSKAREQPDLNRFDAEHTNRNKTSNNELNGACGTVRKKMKKQEVESDNNDKCDKKDTQKKTSYDQDEINKLVDDSVDKVLSLFFAQIYYNKKRRAREEKRRNAQMTPEEKPKS